MNIKKGKLINSFKHLVCLGFALLLIATSAYAQRITVSASVDSTVMLIGDQTDIHLIVNRPAAVEVQFPELNNEQLGKLEIVNIGKIDTLNTRPDLVIQQNITVAAFDSGVYEIPPLPFTYIQGGSTQTLYSQSLSLLVNTMNIDSTFVAPIKPIMREPITMGEILRILGMVLGGLALIGLLIYIFLRRKRKTEPVEEEEVYIPPPHIVALEKLQVLEKEKLWQQDKTKEYYTRLTFVFREYLGGRYKINALESTTEEILDWFQKERFPDTLTSKLEATLQASDLVKFAKSKPGPSVHEEALETAYEFIHATKCDLSEEDVQNLAKHNR